jgi:diguanylate cyclase (GGDEF)-like protein
MHGAVGRDADETTRISERGPATPARGITRRRPRLIFLAGTNVGAIHPVGHGTVLGRASSATVRVESDEVSRRHARIVEGQGGWMVEDLESRNGTFLNGERVTAPASLTDGDKIELGSGIVLRFAYFDDLDESYHRTMLEGSLRDGLTRAFNRKYFDERLDQEFAYSLRHGTALSLLMMDLDHFKKVNDTYGHPGGDAVLTQMASLMHRIIRAEDVFARYGGEEFAILSRGITLEAARGFAERVRAAVERYPFTCGDKKIAVTVSLGTAAVPAPELLQPAMLVEAADKALYAAKETRNAVR